tara:strand:- start:319 stop:819 length:501 start_codon:yes stop_codon:yes gene_type:complete
MRKKPTGTLVNDALLPGKRIWMLSTGTGIAPFASLIRDPETYEKFDEVILTHTCRKVDELKYGQRLFDSVKNDPLIGELAESSLTYYGSVTQEKFFRQGRVTHLMETGEIFRDLKISKFSQENDRGMICGSMGMLRDTKAILESFGLEEGANNKPSTYVVERAFVD